MKFRIPCFLIAAVALLPGLVTSHASQTPPVVRTIAAPRKPLPPEDASAGATKFSYIVYGDTRGRRDGVELQYEHGLVVDSMLAVIKQLETTEYPVRWVLQTGDAVVDGGDARQWNNSFVGLVNRLTTEGGVPYFLTPGNHDVTVADTLDAPQRQQGLRNYLKAMSELIPADDAPRRLPGYPTYAFGYGNTFVVALDSNIATDATQFEWTRKQLEGLNRNRYTNVVAAFHHPVFSSGPHGGPKLEPQSAAMRARYMPLFQAHHVRVIFAGHDHLFEHWVQRYSDSSGRHRMDLVTTGGGGAPIYTYQGEPDVAQYLKDNQASGVVLEHLVRPGLAAGDNPYHYLVVRVDGDRMDLQVVGVDWGSGWRPYRSNRSDLNDAR